MELTSDNALFHLIYSFAVAYKFPPFISRRLDGFFRLTSISAITLSNFGFFFSGFTSHSCLHFYMVPAALKVVQSIVSQIILGLRAFNLSRRSRSVGWSILGILLIATALEWVATLYQRDSTVDEYFGACLTIFQIGRLAWMYYAMVIFYDLMTTTISMVFLFQYRTSSNTLFSKLTRMIFYDGIGYFVALTSVNVLNIIIYTTPRDIQTAAAPLGYIATWMMSKRLIIHLHEVSVERRNAAIATPVTLESQSLTEPHAASQPIPQLEEPKDSSVSLELTIPEFDEDALEFGLDWSEDVGVPIRVERTVQVQRLPRALYNLEDFSGCGLNSGSSIHDPPLSLLQINRSRIV